MATTITYSGPPAIVSALAQGIREAGATVQFDRPVEERGLGGDAHVVIVYLACEGSKAAILAGVEKFRQSRLGPFAKVEIEIVRDDESE